MELVGKDVAGLGAVSEKAGKARETHSAYGIASLCGVPQGPHAPPPHHRTDLGHQGALLPERPVGGAPHGGDRQIRRRHAAPTQLFADAEQVELAEGLDVHEEGESSVVMHALDLHPSAACHRNVDVLAGGTGAPADLARRPGDVRQESAGSLDLEGREQLRLRHRLDEGHAQAAGGEGDTVPDVAHLAAGILLQGELPDAEGTIHAQLRYAEAHRAVQADHRGALEARGDGAVQILLAHHVELRHQVEPQERGHLDGDAYGFVVDLEGRRVIDLVGAHRASLELVDDLLVRLELHEGRAVVLAELAQGGPHVA
jgi:hypothetical protein